MNHVNVTLDYVVHIILSYSIRIVVDWFCLDNVSHSFRGECLSSPSGWCILHGSGCPVALRICSLNPKDSINIHGFICLLNRRIIFIGLEQLLFVLLRHILSIWLRRTLKCEPLIVKICYTETIFC